ncbi:MAG: hypothetical protein AAFU59_03830 [Pseudomonadota bacterium]
MVEPFIAAGVLNLVWCAVHVFVGGPAVAHPLLRSQELGHATKITQYYCWHLVSLTLGLTGLGFLAVGSGYGGAPLGVFVTVLSAGFALLGIVVAPVQRSSYRVLPQGWLFVPVAALGLWGLLG